MVACPPVQAQTFAIPGPPLLLTILAGAFYDDYFSALMPIGFCATTGSSLCFLLSKVYGKGLLKAMVDEAKLDEFREELGKKTTISDIAQFMLLTRVTPVPNVLVNLASPWMDVPLWVFSLTTFIGAFVARAFVASPPQFLSYVPFFALRRPNPAEQCACHHWQAGEAGGRRADQ